MNSFDPQADEDWEREMGMFPEANFPATAAQGLETNDPLPRSPSPEIEVPTRSPSVEITAHQRSPSVEIVAYNRAPSVVIISPPALRPVMTNDGRDQLATSQELDAWATSVKSQSQAPSRPVFGGRPARIRGETAAAAAQGLFAVLVHILRKPDGNRQEFQAPPGVTAYEKSVKVTTFTQLDCDLRV